jgi:hypothetical protein
MQFSLRTLLLFVTAVAIACSLTKWLHEVGIAISMLSAGIIILCIGLRQKRKSHVVAGCLLIGALILWSPWLLVVECWVGHKRIPVTVCVHDQSGKAIPTATVQIDQSPKASTDANGNATITAEFQICGNKSLFQKTGFIELLGEKVIVKAAGFKPYENEIAELVTEGYWDLYAPKSPVVHVILEQSAPHGS